MTLDAILAFVKSILKQYWPGLAVAFFDYEESRVDHAQEEQAVAELAAKNLTDEKTIRDAASAKSSADIIKDAIGSSAGSNKP